MSLAEITGHFTRSLEGRSLQSVEIREPSCLPVWSLSKPELLAQHAQSLVDAG